MFLLPVSLEAKALTFFEVNFMYRGALLVVMAVWGSIYAVVQWLFEGQSWFFQFAHGYLKDLLLVKVRVDDAVAKGWDVEDSLRWKAQAIDWYTQKHGRPPEDVYHYYNAFTHQIQAGFDWVNTLDILSWIGRIDSVFYYGWVVVCFLGACLTALPIIEKRKAMGINNFSDIGGG